MADRRVRYVLEVDYDGESVVLKAADDLEAVDSAATKAGEGLERTGGGFERIAAGAAVVGGAMFAAQEGLEKVQAAAQFAYDTLKEGSALADARGDFEDLAQGIGMTADALEGDMSLAAAGLMTDAELVGQASELMALNLGLTGEEITKLTGLAAELDMDWQTLMDTLNTGSTRGLKSLGLNIDEVKGKVAELEEAGMSADKAFLWAIIESAEDKVGRTGKKSEEASGQIQILEKTVQGVQEAFALGAAEGFADALAEIAGIAPAAGAGLGEMARSGAELITGLLMPAAEAFSQTPFFQYLYGLGFSIGSTRAAELEREAYQAALSGDAWEDYYRELAAGSEVQEEVGDGMERDWRAAERYTQALQGLAEAMSVGKAEAYAEAISKTGGYYEDLTRETGELVRQQEALAEAQELWAEYTREATAQGGDYFSQITSSGQAQWDLAAALYAAADGYGAGMAVLGDIGVEYDIFSEKTRAAGIDLAQQQAIIDNLARAAQAGVIPWENYTALVERAIEVARGAYSIDLGVREMPEMDDRGFREGFQENFEQAMQDMPAWVVKLEADNMAVEAAVEESKAMVLGFTEPVYNATVDLNYESVSKGVGEVVELMNSIPERRELKIDISVTGMNLIEELRAQGALGP